ncbi:MAG: enoyl-CoA hydratase-related protein [Chloroflexaceae bacterium]|jgi:enoyl-CoA hydratase/carnithine racemase|nr:enoyl-CoA hydratase-related protein [Chloroflexaceae bacterium]
MSDYQFLKLNVQFKVGVLTIDRPPVNALNADVLRELDRMLDEIAANSEIKALVVTGAGQQVFIAGADINTFAEIGALPDKAQVVQEAVNYAKLGQEVFLKLDRLSIPTIAAVNGACVGGGMELAMACDIRYAADNARLGQPEIGLGIIPGWGGTQRLPRIVGEGRALELILTGDTIPAPEALRIGLVNKVVPAAQLLRECQGLARKLAEKSRVATSAALRAVTGGTTLSIEDGLALERQQFETMSLSEDMREGIGAFLQKRRPEFKDK